MNAVTQEKSVAFTFAQEATEELLDQAVSLMNTVANSEKTVGFSATLTEEQSTMFRSWMKKKIEHRNSHVLVGYNDGALKAITVIEQPSGENNKHQVTASRTILHPDHRGSSAARDGMYTIARRCKEIGVEVILLDVTKGSPAEQVWRHYGFTQYGELPYYSKVNGEMKAGIYMYQKVDDILSQLSKAD